MRILYVSHTHPPEGTILDNVGGMQRVSRQLIDELQRRGDVQVITETINAAGRGLIALKTASFLVKSLLHLPAKARALNADAILFSSMVTASLAYFIRRQVDIPMVTINHGRDVTLKNPIYQAFLPHVFKALDGVISVSRATRQECIKRGMDAEKGVALSNGFNLSAMNDMPEKKFSRKALQEKFGVPLENRNLLLTVGRQVKRKGHEWFIREVMPHIKSDVIYLTIGDGPEEKRIERAKKQSAQRQYIFLLGRQPDEVLKQAYAAADLFIMPNVPVKGDMEGFGIVLLEANMAETPAVASDLEGIKDVITPGENGYKISALHAMEFAEKVDEVLQGNLEQFSRRTRQFVEKQFAWKEVANNYVTALKRVIACYPNNESRNNKSYS